MSVTTLTVAQASTRVVRLQGGGLRFLDVQQMPDEHFQVVTRPNHELDNTQQWRIIDLGRGVSAIQQISSGRFLEAHEAEELDFRVVTRPRRSIDSQRWRIQDLGGGFLAIEQLSSGRFIEATVDGDFIVVTRPSGNSEQTWRIGEL